MIRNLAASTRAFTSNVFLITGDRTVLVDPGANFDVVSEVETHAESLDAIVLTHTHEDHVGNTEDVRTAFDVEVWGFDPDHRMVDHAIADGDTVTLGDHDYLALHSPGHKHDHLCFYAADPGILLAGDLIFDGGSFGRTDLAEGDRDRLIRSIEYVRETVDDDLAEIHTGHGPSITDTPVESLELSAQAARFSA
jgi:hydroxyacylglutathione hydrolase